MYGICWTLLKAAALVIGLKLYAPFRRIRSSLTEPQIPISSLKDSDLTQELEKVHVIVLNSGFTLQKILTFYGSDPLAIAT